MVRLTPAAINDIRQIFTRTKKDFGLAQADKYYRLLFKSFRRVDNRPNLGKNYEWIRQGIFGYSVESHVIFYRIVKSDILIVRVLHKRRDHEQHLKS